MFPGLFLSRINNTPSILMALRYLFMMGFLFFSDQAISAQLEPINVNCTSGGSVTFNRSGNVGDTIQINATGNCGSYYLSSVEQHVTSSPPFGSLNNSSAIITLDSVGGARVYITSSTPPYSGALLLVTINAAPSPVTVSGMFLDLQNETQLTVGPPIGLFIAAFDGSTLLMNALIETYTGYSFTVPRDSTVVGYAISTNYVCGTFGYVMWFTASQDTVDDSHCSYNPPQAEFDALKKLMLVKVKPTASVGSVAASSINTVNQSPDAPVTYRGVCTSTDGGVEVSGTATSADWNASVTINLGEPTIGKTYNCSVDSEVTINNNTYQSGAVGVENNPIITTSAPTPSNPIPTLSQWAQILMMLAMIATAGLYGWRMKSR